MTEPIAPGCELAEWSCGCEHGCDQGGEYCATHQDEGDMWPCPEQQEYAETPEYQLNLLERRVIFLAKALDEQIAAVKLVVRENKRLARITEQALMPFVRDMLRSQDKASLQMCGMDLGDAESLLGIDPAGGGGYTFNRGGPVYGITYKASDGTEWVNGVKKPLTPDQRLKRFQGGRRG